MEVGKGDRDLIRGPCVAMASGVKMMQSVVALVCDEEHRLKRSYISALSHEDTFVTVCPVTPVKCAVYTLHSKPDKKTVNRHACTHVDAQLCIQI